MRNWIGQIWCQRMHSRAMWPIHGKYICAQCLREHPVSWESPAQPAPATRLRLPETEVSQVSVLQ